ncbi:lysoplasmalogenase [Flaviaesturariibacter flavus]|uniref:Lysoplasmalogenase n=1 Tax=Flaviaesturariibacter flavus TaxID=2502780 RepID=A0A4V2NVN4_9BACT|nr:lysoplasmalogenase [Flaviaesturariibacter flavus]TCJ14152.1 lysoplasmalogenase [Flaviaesturariibacter flavus]
MKKTYWILFYLIALVTDGVFIYMQDESLRVFSKTALMLTLLLMVKYTTPKGSSRIKSLLFTALAASLLGDVLLLFEVRSPDFFLGGIGAFLVAQLAYALAFNHLRVLKGIAFRLVALVPVVAYYVCLIALLWEHLGALRVPVLVYGAVISMMLAMALQLARLKNRRSALLIFGGALLFVVSDSTLALNRFYEPFRGAGLVVMGTYGFAQLLLTLGLLNHAAPPPVKRKSEEAMRMELLN